MYKKHIVHLMMVSLKFFFDFDYNSCHQIFYSSILFACLCKLFLSKAGAHFYDGLLTVKEDALGFKADMMLLKERWENSDTRENVLTVARNIKNNLREDPRNWLVKINSR